MKRILISILLLGCFSCYDYTQKYEEELKIENLADDERLFGSFVNFKSDYTAPHLKSLTENEKIDFKISAMLCFPPSSLLHKILFEEIKETISVGIDENLPEDIGGRYDIFRSALFFKVISEPTLLHESLHCIQHKKFKYPMSKDNKGMIEFEVYMATDIIHAIERGKIPDKSSIMLNVGTDQDTYLSMLGVLASGGNIDSEVFCAKFKEWAKGWDHKDAVNMQIDFLPRLILYIFQWCSRRNN